MFNNQFSIVKQNTEGVLTTTSLIIAEGTEAQHSSVIRLIRDNHSDFEEFGRVGFEIQPFDTPGGRQERTIAVLNREQALLLMTYMRNTQIVRRFKKHLVRAFSEMEKQLAKPQFDPSILTRSEILKIALNAEEERLALETKNKQLEPKAEAYDSFMDSTGKYNVGTVAKMLGKSQNWLFRELRNRGVLISKGAMRNTPYQQYMRYFEVKAHTFERSNGEQGTSYTTYVQPSGVNFIRKKLGLERIDPLSPLEQPH